MTDEQLRKGNELTGKIGYSERIISDLKKSLKIIEFEDTSFVIDNDIETIRVKGKECSVNKDRLVKFLTSELTLQTELKKELETQFKSI